jgi:predicted Zn-dependent peptidase
MVINLKSQTNLSGFYIVYDGSTLLEERGIFGISHLMEHLMCKNFEHLRETFEKEGIEWNAYTSQNEIVFYFTGLDEYLNKRKYEIIDLMSDFNITKEQFENEKKIVLQEYGDYFGDQSESHLLNLLRKLHKNYDAIGLREDLESLKFMNALDFFEKQFSKPSKIINVSPKNVFKYDGDFNNLSTSKVLEMGPFEDAILEKRPDYGDKVSLIMTSPLIEGDNNYITFINSMLSLGLSSPLYVELREKRGLVYYVRCGQSRYNKQGFTNISTQTTQKNVDLVTDAVRYVLKNPDKFLNKERFDTIRDSYLIKLEKDKINRYVNVTRWIQPRGWNVKEIIDSLTLDKIREVYDKYFIFDNFHISNDKEEFSNLTK